MIRYYCTSPHYRPWLPWYYPQGYAKTKLIRLSIFLITGLCAGFPALFWAVSVLYRHRKSGGRLSTIAVFLLLSNLLELILILVLLILFYSVPLILSVPIFEDDYATCITFHMLFGARICGHLLHQLLALESILTQKYPSLAVIFSPHCSIILCVIVWLVAVGCQFIPSLIINEINICVCVLPVIVCALTCVVTRLVTCKASPDTNQPTDRKPGVLVLCVAMFTLIILYTPFFLDIITGLSFMLDSLASMRLISEPLLCVLICRENRMVETAHTQTDHTQ